VTQRNRSCAGKLAEKKIGFLLILLLGALPLLSCAFIEKMGTVPIGTPTKFEAKGETIQIWQVAVNPNQQYMLVVKPVNVRGSSGASVTVCTQNVDFCADKHTLAQIYTYKDGATLEFSSPVTPVYILIIASIGENGEKLGTFSIEVSPK
jgi:hypothetical protein